MQICPDCGAEMTSNEVMSQCGSCNRKIHGAPTPPVENLPNTCPVCCHPIEPEHDDFGCHAEGCGCTRTSADTAARIGETMNAEDPLVCPECQSINTHSSTCSKYPHNKDEKANSAESDAWADATPEERVTWAKKAGVGDTPDRIEDLPEPHRSKLAAIVREATPKLNAENMNSGDCEKCAKASMQGRELADYPSEDVFTKDHRFHLINKETLTPSGAKLLIAECGAQLEVPAENANAFEADACEQCQRRDVPLRIYKRKSAMADGQSEVRLCADCLPKKRGGLNDPFEPGDGKPFKNTEKRNKAHDKNTKESVSGKNGRSFGSITEAECPNEAALRAKLVSLGAMTPEEGKAATFHMTDKGVVFCMPGSNDIIASVRCYGECCNSLSNRGTPEKEPASRYNPDGSIAGSCGKPGCPCHLYPGFHAKKDEKKNGNPHDEKAKQSAISMYDSASISERRRTLKAAGLDESLAERKWRDLPADAAAKFMAEFFGLENGTSVDAITHVVDGKCAKCEAAYQKQSMNPADYCPIGAKAFEKTNATSSQAAWGKADRNTRAAWVREAGVDEASADSDWLALDFDVRDKIAKALWSINGGARENAARFERPCPDCGGMCYVEDAQGNDVKCGKCKGTGVETAAKLNATDPAAEAAYHWNGTGQDFRLQWLKLAKVDRAADGLELKTWGGLPADVRAALVASWSDSFGENANATKADGKKWQAEYDALLGKMRPLTALMHQLQDKHDLAPTGRGEEPKGPAEYVQVMKQITELERQEDEMLARRPTDFENAGVEKQMQAFEDHCKSCAVCNDTFNTEFPDASKLCPEGAKLLQAENKNAAAMDRATADHFYKWLENVPEDEQHTVEQGIIALLRSETTLVDEGKSWNEIARMAGVYSLGNAVDPKADQLASIKQKIADFGSTGRVGVYIGGKWQNMDTAAAQALDPMKISDVAAPQADNQNAAASEDWKLVDQKNLSELIPKLREKAKADPKGPWAGLLKEAEEQMTSRSRLNAAEIDSAAFAAGVEKIVKANPDKDRTWAESQLRRAIDNIDGRADAKAIASLLSAVFEIENANGTDLEALKRQLGEWAYRAKNPDLTQVERDQARTIQGNLQDQLDAAQRGEQKNAKTMRNAEKRNGTDDECELCGQPCGGSRKRVKDDRGTDWDICAQCYANAKLDPEGMGVDPASLQNADGSPEQIKAAALKVKDAAEGGPFDQPNMLGCNACDGIKEPLNKDGYCKDCAKAQRHNQNAASMAAFDEHLAACPGCAAEFALEQPDPAKLCEAGQALLTAQNAGDPGESDSCDGCKKPTSSDLLRTVKAADGIHTKELCAKCVEKPEHKNGRACATCGERAENFCKTCSDPVCDACADKAGSERGGNAYCPKCGNPERKNGAASDAAVAKIWDSYSPQERAELLKTAALVDNGHSAKPWAELPSAYKPQLVRTLGFENAAPATDSGTSRNDPGGFKFQTVDKDGRVFGHHMARPEAESEAKAIGGTVQPCENATDLACKHCGDSLGKDTQLEKQAYCGTCGKTTPNPRGDGGEAQKTGACAQCGENGPVKTYTHGLPGGKPADVCAPCAKANGLQNATSPEWYRAKEAYYSHIDNCEVCGRGDDCKKGSEVFVAFQAEQKKAEAKYYPDRKNAVDTFSTSITKAAAGAARYGSGE